MQPTKIISPGVLLIQTQLWPLGDDMPISKKALDRIGRGLKRYQDSRAAAKKRDVSESDTVVIVGAILADVLRYE